VFTTILTSRNFLKILLQLSNKQQQQKYEGRLERALFFVLIHLHRGRDIIKTGQANKADIKDCTSTQIQNDKNYKEGYLKEHDSITWRSFRDGKADLKIIESENFDFLTEVSEKDSDFNSGRSFEDSKADLKIIESENFDFLTEVSEKDSDFNSGRSFEDSKADLKIIESENFDFLTEVSEKDSDFNSGRSFASLRMTDASGKWRGRSGDSGKILFHSNL
jgi:hypothetical protein